MSKYKNFGVLLSKTNNPELISYEEFEEEFYKHASREGLNIKNQEISDENYKGKQFSKLLNKLYVSTEYQSFRKVLTKIPNSYITDTYSLVLDLVEQGKYEKLELAFNMFLKKLSLIRRAIPNANYSNLMDGKQQLLDTYNEIISKITNGDENSESNKAIVQFDSFFGRYSEDEDLKDYYNYLIYSIGPEIIKSIEIESNKIDELILKYADGYCTSYQTQHNFFGKRVEPLAKYLSGGKK
jgi:hypothetical protein